MKLPFAVRLIAAWCCLGLIYQVRYVCNILAVRYTPAGMLPFEFYTALWGTLVIGVVWQIVCLIGLKAFARWFAVVFFSWSTVATIWRTSGFISRPAAKVPNLLIFTVIVVTLNVLSSWYIGRRSFRIFAVQFVAERKRLKQARAANKPKR